MLFDIFFLLTIISMIVGSIYGIKFSHQCYICNMDWAINNENYELIKYYFDNRIYKYLEGFIGGLVLGIILFWLSPIYLMIYIYQKIYK